MGSISISGYHLVQFLNDEFCSELFCAQNSFNVFSHTKEKITVEILYGGAVCS